MEELDLTGVERVLVVMAHPDDVDFGFAGSVAVMTVDAIWLGIGRDNATHYVDITTAVDRKIEALLSHKSQLPDPDTTETMVRSWTGAIAQAAGLPEGRAAEAMRVVNTR